MEQLDIFGGSEMLPDSNRGAIVDWLLNRPKPADWPLVVSYGGGKNSTALLVEMRVRGIRPDAIVFADTGEEKDETYAFIERFNNWLLSVGFPSITVVRYEIQNPKLRKRVLRRFRPQDWKNWELAIADMATKAWENHVRQSYKYRTLGEECVILEAIPAKAYGQGGCSSKWKIEVTQKRCNSQYANYRMAVGIHSGEQRRVLDKAGNFPQRPDNIFVEYPLIEWDIDELGCLKIMRDILGEVPLKSACWFCPNASASEVLALKESDPDRFELGCYIEERNETHATNKKIGLGRTSFKWRELGKKTPLEIAAIDMKASTRACSCTD